MSSPEATAEIRNGVEIVYCLRSGDYVKVGTTKNLRKRLVSITSGNTIKPPDLVNGTPVTVLGVTPGGRRTEQSIQYKLGPWHVLGEWFRACDEVLSLVADNFDTEFDLATLPTATGKQMSFRIADSGREWLEGLQHETRADMSTVIRAVLSLGLTVPRKEVVERITLLQVQP